MTTLLKIGICALPLMWAGAASAQGYGEPGQNPSQANPSQQQKLEEPPPAVAPQPQAPSQTGQMNQQQQQPMGEMGGQASNQTALTPQEFVNKAAQANLLEVKLGRLAADKGSSQKVKSFGQEMIEDHTKANADLRKIAVKNGLNVPTTLSPDKQDIYDHLSSLSGTQFDNAYLTQMMQDHHDAISLFSQEANATDNPELASYATKTLPTLKKHEARATRDSHKM
ncbi:MAG: DUF4142 domain-containing protein [Polyangia bacterium]|jgi:putative membrane protein